MRKVVVLGGGSGLSSLLKGLKKYDLDITAVVSVCDDGNSTGRLREEFDTFAVGDLRRVLCSLADSDEMFLKMFEYRFNTTSDLNGHTVGNLILTALYNMNVNIEDGINSLVKVLNIKGQVLPYTLDKPILIGKMKDGSIIRGEHNITETSKEIDNVYYEGEVKVNNKVLDSINNADLIILSMGSLYTSLIPNLLSKDLISTLDKCKAKIMYIANMTTQPGETDNFKVSDHIKAIDKYLGKKKISIVIANNGHIDDKIMKRYETLEQKEPVLFDKENLSNIKVIEDDYVTIIDEKIRYDSNKLSKAIWNYLMESD